MTQATQTTLDRPVWVDLGAKDAGAAREFYGSCSAGRST
jgi:hypothetical protein